MQRVKEGESPEAISDLLGFHQSCIYRWIAQYREGGYEALKKKPAAGREPELNGEKLLAWPGYTDDVFSVLKNLCHFARQQAEQLEQDARMVTKVQL